jgi:hypothetical protein
MNEALTNQKTKDIMLNLFPQSKPPPQMTYQQPPQMNKPQYFNPNMFPAKSKQESTNSKKWYIAIVISVLAIFMFSSVSLNFLDDICAQKNIEAFDKRGDPQLSLLVVLFLFLLSVTRMLLMFL